MVNLTALKPLQANGLFLMSLVFWLFKKSLNSVLKLALNLTNFNRHLQSI